MKLLETIYDILLLEYSNRLINDLTIKFKNENPNLDDKTILMFINGFKKIKDNPKIKQKDITRYSWEELENVVISNQSDRIKAGKINDGEPAGDSNLIYNQNGLRIYQAKSKEDCIKYGNGYSFCISSRGNDNLYSSYRIRKSGAPYFIFDDTKTSEQDEDGGFIDPTHLLVLFIYYREDPDTGAPFYFYTISDANNDGDDDYKDDPWNDAFDKIVKLYPRLKGLKDLFKWSPPNKKEEDEYKLEKKYNDKIEYINDRFSIHYPDDFNKFPDDLQMVTIKGAVYNVDRILNNDGTYDFYFFESLTGSEPDGLFETHLAVKKGELEKIYEDLKKSWMVEDIRVTKKNVSDYPYYIEYLKQFVNLVKEYKKELYLLKNS